MIKKTLLSMSILLVLFSCQSTRVSSPDTFMGKQIYLSEGGGISGQTTQHIILENGQVFVRTFYPKSIRESDKLRKKTVNEIFKRIDLLNIPEMQFQHPGNMTYGLALKNDQEFHEIKWGDPKYPVPDSVMKCYQFIQSQLTLK